MAELLRQGVITSLSLLTVAEYFPGLVVAPGLINFFWSGFGLTLLNFIVKPVIKLILLPLNLLTLGVFSWISLVIVLILGDKLIGPMTLVAFKLPAWNQGGFSMPAVTVNIFFSYLIASLLITIGVKIYKIIL